MKKGNLQTRLFFFCFNYFVANLKKKMLYLNKALFLLQRFIIIIKKKTFFYYFLNESIKIVEIKHMKFFYFFVKSYDRIWFKRKPKQINNYHKYQKLTYTNDLKFYLQVEIL